MKRKICSCFLVLVLSVCLLLPVSAAGCMRVYVPMTCYRFVAVQNGCRTVTVCMPFTREQDAPPAAPETPGVPKTPDKPKEPVVPETPAAPEAPEIGSDYEQQVVTLVNQERAAYGLPALGTNAQLADGAKLKSQYLHDNRYFDHNSPTYGTPFEMMRALGITYSYAGENIAMGYSTPEAVVRAWMQSPGHRANILSANFTSIGVGYVADGGYWTQWFHG